LTSPSLWLALSNVERASKHKIFACDLLLSTLERRTEEVRSNPFPGRGHNYP